MVLVFVVTLIWSILSFLNNATSEKSQNFKGIVSEKWSLPSQMPFTYAQSLSEGGAREDGDIKPQDSMTWQFFGGSTDPKIRTFNNIIFAFAMEPSKLLTMMDDLDSLQGTEKAEFEKVVEKLKNTRQGIILGKNRLQNLEKNVGDKITLYGLNYKDITLEFEIVGLFPPGRYDSSATINRDYLNAAVDAYPITHNGKAHPLAQKSLNLVWLRVANRDDFNQVGQQILNSPSFSSPSVKFESASAGISTFLAAYRDIIGIMRWILAPAILITLSVVISNAISISVRERRKEMAVLKVLGFRPNQVLGLVLGEAMLLGGLAGAASSILTYVIVNKVINGIAFPIAFFSKFYIDPNALWWGFAIGLLTSLAGSIAPAWSTRSIKVVDVFSKVA